LCLLAVAGYKSTALRLLTKSMTVITGYHMVVWCINHTANAPWLMVYI